MPDIELLEVLLDPEIAGERFAVLRRQEAVSSHGRSVLTPANHSAIGAVTPTGDNSLVREQAYTSQANSIRVVTQFRLRGAGKDGQGRLFQPDLVFWNNTYYIVQSVNDYSQYGAGFIEAECTAFDYQDRVADLAINQT